MGSTGWSANGARENTTQRPKCNHTPSSKLKGWKFVEGGREDERGGKEIEAGSPKDNFQFWINFLLLLDRTYGDLLLLNAHHKSAMRRRG